MNAPKLDNDTRDAANAAVREALLAFSKQPLHVTVLAKIRFAIYWATYWVRLRIAIRLVIWFGMDDKKVWNRLGL